MVPALLDTSKPYARCYGGEMTSKRYPDEFKVETVRQVTEPGCPAGEVPDRLGGPHSLTQWLKRRGKPEATQSWPRWCEQVTSILLADR